MKRATCPRCKFSRGIVRVAGRWERCHCGALPNSTNQHKLDKQYRLETRLQDLKEGKPW
jgi:hypothetical protein